MAVDKDEPVFPEIAKQFPGNADELKTRLRTSPGAGSDVQKPLKGRLATRMIGGRLVPHWQYDISSGHRLWHRVDKERRVVWLTYAGARPTPSGTKVERTPSTR